MGEAYEGRLFQRLPNRFLLQLASMPGILALVVAVAALFGNDLFAPLVPFLMAAAAMGLVGVVRRKPWPRLVEHQVHADATALTMSKRTLARARIRGAQIVPKTGGAIHLHVKRAWRPTIELVVADVAEGRRVLRALGFDASQTVMRFRARSFAFASYPRATVLFFGVPFGLLIMLILSGLPALAFPIIAGLLIALTIPSNVDVGADGVAITWLGRRRFFPMARILDARPFDSAFGKNRVMGTEITLLGGQSVRLVVGGTWQEDHAAALAERIREARLTFEASAAPDVAAQLDRHRRDMPEWIRGLRALGVGSNAGMRVAPVQPEALWRIVENPGARAVERAAAAVALGASLDDEGKHRLRIAAGAIAEPKLRVAVEAALEADERSIEEALARVTPHEE